MTNDLSALNKQAIEAAKHHMGDFAWPTVLLTVLVVLAFIANLVLFVQGVIPLPVAFALYAMLTYMSYTPLHEAAHQNIQGRHTGLKWVNDVCGYLVAPIIGVPYASHSIEHFTHHRYTNQPDKDPDFVVSGMRGGLWAVIAYGFKFLWMQNAFFVRTYWSRATLLERAIYCAELGLSLGWRIAALALISAPGLWWLLLMAYLLGGFFTAYWFAYRPHLPYQEAERYRNTNSLLMPRWMKPLEWFWLGQNLHSIHHLFPRVPFYRYHVLHRSIEPVMRAHGTPMIGVFSRQPIAAKS